jgi:hypothetical protein
LDSVSGFIEIPAWSSVGVFVHRPVCGSFKYSVVVKGVTMKIIHRDDLGPLDVKKGRIGLPVLLKTVFEPEFLVKRAFFVEVKVPLVHLRILVRV